MNNHSFTDEQLLNLVNNYQSIVEKLQHEQMLLLMSNNFNHSCFDELKTKIDYMMKLEKSYSKKCRKSDAYQKWKSFVKTRDKGKCKICKSTKHIHIHHIKNFKQYPHLRLEVTNGITLCQKCHIKIHKTQSRK